MLCVTYASVSFDAMKTAMCSESSLKHSNLREGETYLSVTWLEHFDPRYDQGLIQAADAIRRQLIVKPTDGFSTTAVGDFYDICERFDEKVRVLHEPENPENTGHVAIRRFPRDNLDLFDMLASDAFVDTRVAADVVP